MTATAVSCEKRDTVVPGTTRESGQSSLMDQTFAGKNACNPDEHNRPFVIEWDATDSSSFESLAGSDIVFVKYEGCSLRVLDECKNDDIRGSEGAYKPTEWTAGSLETIDIHTGAELEAKLPLGKATLGGRVEGGEKFHMEYFVAGTRYATRDAVYAGDLEGKYGCDDATHFVYGYNLGAFALGSAAELKSQAGVSAFGFGATGKTHNGRSAEKKGGDLGVCKSDSATELAGCKAPIRLNLRKIRPGTSPEAKNLAAPDTPDSLAAAAMVKARVDMSEEAKAYMETALRKEKAGDGKGCLKAWDKHDKLDPKHKSTDPRSEYPAQGRARCLMIAGKCDAGKSLLRKAVAGWEQQYGAEYAERTVDAMVMQNCQGKMKPVDAMRKALMELQMAGSQGKHPASYCQERISTIARLLPKVKPRNDDDMQIKQAPYVLSNMGPMCLQRAGDCKAAFEVYKKYPAPHSAKYIEKLAGEEREQHFRISFEAAVSKCKGKI